MKKVYVVISENFGAIASECGACNILGVVDSQEKAVKMIINAIEDDKENNDFKPSESLDYANQTLEEQIIEASGIEMYRYGDENDFDNYNYRYEEMEIK